MTLCRAVDDTSVKRREMLHRSAKPHVINLEYLVTLNLDDVAKWHGGAAFHVTANVEGKRWAAGTSA